MIVTEVVALAGVVTSIFTSIWGLFKRKEAQTLSAKLDTVAEGLAIVEEAIEDNKEALSKTAAGNQIVNTIKEYGPDAKAAVTAARELVHTLETK